MTTATSHQSEKANKKKPFCKRPGTSTASRLRAAFVAYLLSLTTLFSTICAEEASILDPNVVSVTCSSLDSNSWPSDGILYDYYAGNPFTPWNSVDPTYCMIDLQQSYYLESAFVAFNNQDMFIGASALCIGDSTDFYQVNTCTYMQTSDTEPFASGFHEF